MSEIKGTRYKTTMSGGDYGKEKEHMLSLKSELTCT